MNTVIVSTLDVPCGISEHTGMLMEAVQLAGFRQRHDVYSASQEALDPQYFFQAFRGPGQIGGQPIDVLHLNYHAALHSRWTPETIRRVQAVGIKVLVTYHDSGVPNSDQCKAICGAADWFVLHEPYDDLPAHGEYLRMGVPDWDYEYLIDRSVTKGRPVLGSVGFPFPWKCYDELARVTKLCGWALLLIAPNATSEAIARWEALNPYTMVVPDWESRSRVVGRLMDCDATAFTYVTHNTGQSGAILQGIAARKPVIALSTCRQMRALYMDKIGKAAIRWAADFDDVSFHLAHMPIQRVDPMTVVLAEQDSWAKVGQRYAAIYNQLGGRA